MLKYVSRAFISVCDTTGLAEFSKGLVRWGVKLVAAGPAITELRNAGLEVADVSQLTGFPSIMDGWVSTLHPRVHAGILAGRKDYNHERQLDEHNASFVDMVVVNLNPVGMLAGHKTTAEDTFPLTIDVGGVALLYSAARNSLEVAAVTSPSQYSWVLPELEKNRGQLSYCCKLRLAQEAFVAVSKYSQSISDRFSRMSRNALPDEIAKHASYFTWIG